MRYTLIRRYKHTDDRESLLYQKRIGALSYHLASRSNRNTAVLISLILIINVMPCVDNSHIIISYRSRWPNLRTAHLISRVTDALVASRRISFERSLLNAYRRLHEERRKVSELPFCVGSPPEQCRGGVRRWITYPPRFGDVLRQ